MKILICKANKLNSSFCGKKLIWEQKKFIFTYKTEIDLHVLPYQSGNKIHPNVFALSKLNIIFFAIKQNSISFSRSMSLYLGIYPWKISISQILMQTLWYKLTWLPWHWVQGCEPPPAGCRLCQGGIHTCSLAHIEP